MKTTAGPGGWEAEVTEPVAASDYSTRVLVVDDDPDMVKFIQTMLALEGFETIPAYNGEEAVRFACAELPDIILLDIMMRDMDGFDVCERLQRNPSTSHIPVVFVTAKTAREHRRHGLSLGARGYITKPFRPPELLNTMLAAVS